MPPHRLVLVFDGPQDATVEEAAARYVVAGDEGAVIARLPDRDRFFAVYYGFYNLEYEAKENNYLNSENIFLNAPFLIFERSLSRLFPSFSSLEAFNVILISSPSKYLE